MSKGAKKIIMSVILLIITSVVIGLGFIWMRFYKSLTPESFKIMAADGGIVISWEKVESAELYAVLRKENDEWIKIADTNELSYCDTNVTGGETYIYSVRCENAEGNKYIGSFNKDGISIAYVNSPILDKCNIVANGVEVTWKEVPLAEKYRVFRAVGNGKWDRIADVDNLQCSFIDKDIMANIPYTYTVRCINEEGTVYTSGYDKDGLKIQCLESPALARVSAEADGIEISWQFVEAFDGGYRVFKKKNSGKWEIVGNTQNDENSFLDTNVEYDNEYTYTVRCIDKEKQYYLSGYDAKGLTIAYCEIPELISINSRDSGIEISWNEVNHAEKYRVFRRENKKWKTLETVQADVLTYCDEDVQRGKTYIYTVRCMNEEESAYISYFDIKGIKIEY